MRDRKKGKEGEINNGKNKGKERDKYLYLCVYMTNQFKLNL